MKPKRKLLSLLLAICLVAGLMPTTALAAEGDKTIMLGTSGISGYDSTKGYDYIYYGNWSAPDNYTTSGPIKWRVLDDQTNTGGTGLFLLSDVLLGSGTRGGVYFDKSSRNSNAWQGSDAQTWCNNFYSDNFSTGEQSAVIATTKSDEAFTSSTYHYQYAASENILNGDKVFFLSTQEAENEEYGFTDDAARVADYGDSAGVWWLRSRSASFAGAAGAAGAVTSSGYVTNNPVGIMDWAVRPAFNLDLTSVLFTSAAAGGKSASGMDSGLTAVDDYSGSEWKLTLLDETREFAVTEQTVSGKPGDTITLNYTGATTGENEYISVIIADENGAQYYGRVAQPDSADGQVKIKIPDSLAAGEYTLNVFSEQYNGDYKTDYASAFAEVALTVEEAAAPGIDTGKAIQLVDSGTAANISGGQADNIYFGTYQQSSDGSGGYNTDPIKWRVLENANGQLFLLSDQNLDVFQYHTEYESVTWETSTMRSWLNGYGAAQNTGSDNGIDYTSDNFINTAFSDGEQGAIVDTTVVNDDNPDYNTEGGENTNDKIFLLSVDEARNSSYFADDNSRKGTNTAYVADGGKIDGNMFGVGAADYWWLRSPGDYGFIAAIVYGYGGVDSRGSSVSYVSRAVRPAFNLDLTSVLFTSAAAGGKSASGMDSGLTAVDDYSGSEWKLTLLDETREFAVTEQTVSGKPGDTITLNYTGATTGENEYISVIIADENGAQYYGRVAQPDSADGQVKIKIPDSLAAGEYTLNVFSEQYNGDYKTDYASAFAEVALTVEEAAAPGIDTGKAIQLVDSGTAANIGGGQADNIYFGTYQQSSDGNSGYNIDPIKWRVLSMNGNSGTYSDGTETVDANNAMFLLSDGLLGTGTYGGVYFQQNYHSASGTYHKGSAPTDGNHTNCQIANAWQDSDAQEWCETFYSNNLTAQEKGAVLATTKSDKAFTSSTYNIPFAASNNILNGDKVFFLSAEEAETGDYGFGSDNDRKANYGSSAGCWWLRSPYADSAGTAGFVFSDGSVYGDYVSSGWAARPAFNVNLKSVLFTSAAVGGKSSGTVDADVLQSVSEYTGNEWKLTLLDDEHKNFEISNTTINDNEDTITFSYSGVQTGTNEYISVIIEDNGAITHYGRILQPGSASGTASFMLPAGVTLSENTKLYVFNEQYNGDKMTDYASALCEVQFDTTAPILSNGSATRDSATTATVKFTSNEAGRYYYVVDNNATATGGIDTTTTAGTSCNANVETTITLDSLSGEYIHIVVKDADNNVSDILTIQIPAYTSTTFTVTVNVDPSDGGTASANYTTAAPNTEITLTATPSTGYHFKEWQVTEGTASIGDDNKFTMPAENVTVKAVFEAHSFTQENTDSEYLASSATCTQAATYYYSCSCGAKDTNNTFTSGEALGHTLGADWKYNDSNHWKECEDCGAKVDEAAHVYTDDADTTCNDCGYVKPTYAISASPETLDFGSKAEGYAAAPDAQEVTITNTGKQSVTVNLPTSTNYIITAGEGFANGTATLAANDGTATFTVQPKTGLGVGSHDDTLNISGSDGTSANVQLSFAVTETAPVTYTLTVELNGGSGNATDGEYPAGKDVNIDAGTRSGYRFVGWTSSNGGTFADPSSASTTFTMPAADTTITANWKDNGGGSTGGSTTDYYRLTFDTNGGSEISSIRRAEYTTIDLTDYTPTREGYEFTGWYADEDLTDKITSIRLIRNTTVYAGWEEIKENPGTGFENPFTDVSENDWFFNDVKFVYQNGLMNGTSATTFSPEGTTSRGMIVTILWRMAGSPDMEDKIWGYPFADVDATAYYGTAVYWARLNGIAGGYDDATFGPNDPITREQMAAILYRYAQYKGYDVSAKADLNKFTDADEISNYALEALQWANAEGLINGKGDGVLDPKGQATRAEAAAILTRFCENYATTK